MALPQQLQGMSVMPQAPQVDPRMFALDAQGALMSAQMGMKLGQEMAGLQNLKSKLELEKVEIAAKKANHALQEKYALQAETQLPQMMEAQKQKYLADIEASKAAIQTQQYKTAADIAGLRFGAEKSGAELSQLSAFTNLGGPKAAGEAAATAAKTQATTAGRLPEDQAALTAEATARGKAKGELMGMAQAGQELSGGITPAVAPDSKIPFYLQKGLEKTTGKKVDVFGTGEDLPDALVEWKSQTVTDPDTREVSVVSQAFNKINGAPIVGRTKKVMTVSRGDDPDKNKVIALAQALSLAENAKESLGKYTKGGSLEALAALWANTPATGLLSVGKRAVGNWYQSSETTALNSKLAALSNTITKELSGSGVTGSEMNRLSPMLVTTGDLADPENAKVKLDGTIKYLNELLQPYEKRGAVVRSRVGGMAGKPAAAKAPAPAPAADGFTRTNKFKTVNGKNLVLMTRVDPATGDKEGKWVPAQ